MPTPDFGSSAGSVPACSPSISRPAFSPRPEHPGVIKTRALKPELFAKVREVLIVGMRDRLRHRDGLALGEVIERFALHHVFAEGGQSDGNFHRGARLITGLERELLIHDREDAAGIGVGHDDAAVQRTEGIDCGAAGEQILAINVIAFERIGVVRSFPDAARGNSIAGAHPGDNRLIRGGGLRRGSGVFHTGFRDHARHSRAFHGSS